jgi:hemolysin activation/secretion protein
MTSQRLLLTTALSGLFLSPTATIASSPEVSPKVSPEISPAAEIAQSTAPSTGPDAITIPNVRDRIETPAPVIPNPQELSPPAPPSSSPPTIEFPNSDLQPESAVPFAAQKIKLNRLEVLGNTVFQQEINGLKADYAKRKEITFEDLVKLRSQITKLYLDNGYLNSGAFIPNNQDLKQGNLTIQIVEGELEKIEIVGLARLNESYIRKRIERATQAPLNKSQLERALQLLQIDPLIERVNAELGAGSSPGRNVLRLILKEARPFHAGIIIDNDQSTSIGAGQVSGFVSHDNLLGFGDRLSLEYGRTRGLNIYGVNYTMPLNARDGTLALRYGSNNSKIVESLFEDLGIRSNSETLSFSLRQPLVRTPNTEFAVGIGFDLRRSETFILDDIPFSFAEGPQDGRSKVAVLRFVQDWVNRDKKRVLAARSQFSVGLDAFGATENPGDIADGQFIAWLGQFQWVQQVSPRVTVVSRLAGQFSSDPLLSLERFSLGGADTVRGYRQNQVVADNGLLGSIEARIPLTNDPNILQITPFLDWGYGWNNRGENPDPGFILSTGIGLRSRFSGFDLRLDYGFPLVSSPEVDEQRFQFSLRYQPL